MKKILCIAMALQLACTTYAGDLLVDVKNHVSADVRNRRVTITLLQPGPVVQGPWLIAGDAVAQLTSASGTTTFSNLLAGAYRLDIAGTPGRSFPFAMPDTNGLVNVSSLIGSTNVNPLFYTASQVDTLLDEIDVVGGDNITVERDGRTFTVSGQGGSGEATNIMRTAFGYGLDASTNAQLYSVAVDTNTIPTMDYVQEYVSLQMAGLPYVTNLDGTINVVRSAQVDPPLHYTDVSANTNVLATRDYVDSLEFGVNAAEVAAIMATNTAGSASAVVANVTNQWLGDINSASNELRAFALTIDPSYWINVKNYGAVGDGVTDDTDAITDAYAVFNDSAEHRVLYFPAGKYLDYGQRSIGPAAAEIPVHTRGTRSVIGDGERTVILAWGTNGPYLSTTNRAVYLRDFILSGPQSTNSSTPLSVVSGKSSGIALFGSDARPVLSRLTVQWFPRYGIFMESHRGPILHDIWAHGNKVGIGIGRGTHGLDASVRFSLCSIGMEFGAQSSNVVDNLPAMVSDGPGGNRVHFSSYGCDIGILMDYPAPGTKFSGTFVSIGHEPFLFGRYSRSLWRPGTSTIDSDWTIPPTASSAETMEVAVDALYIAATPGTASNVFNVRVPTKLTISNSRFNHTAPTPFLRVYSGAGGSVVYRQNVTVSSNNFVGDASYTLFDYGDARGWTNYYSTNLVGSYVGSPLTLTSERLLGRNTASAGPVEEISIGTGLELSGGVLSATGEGGVTYNLVDSTNLPVAGIAATGIGNDKYLRGDGTWDTPEGSGSQTPWTQTINADSFALTNVGGITQTQYSGILQTTKKGAAATSHSYSPFLFDMGDPLTNLFWGIHSVSHTNHYNNSGPDGAFDYVVSMGINSASSPNYNPMKPTLAQSWESDYTTSQGIRQMEHYWSFYGNYTNTHPRWFGASLIFDNSVPSTQILSDWAVSQMAWYDPKQPSISTPPLTIAFDPNVTNTAKLLLNHNSYLDFSLNTRSDGTYIRGLGNSKLLGQYDGKMTLLGAGSNVVFMPKSLAVNSPGLLLGQSNSYAGFRWNHLSNRLEYSVNSGPVAYSSLVWKRFNDVADNTGSWGLSAALAADAGSTTTLGYWTNNFQGGEALVEVTLHSNASADTETVYTVPVTIADVQGSPTTWYEVTPDRKASRWTTNSVTVALDVSGSSNTKAMNFRLRRLLTQSGSSTFYVTVRAVSYTGSASVRFYPVAGTGTGGTVSGIYRHSGGITQILGKTGIGTNSPQSKLHLVGNALMEGTNTGTYFIGNAGGMSNSVDLIAGTGIEITTNADNRSFTIAATGEGGHTGLTNAAVVGTDGDGRLVAGNVTNVFSGTTVNLGSIYSITSATNIYLTAVTEPPAGTYGFWQLTVNATAGITLTNMPTILASDFLKTRTITNGNRATISIEVQPGVYTNMSIVQFR